MIEGGNKSGLEFLRDMGKSNDEDTVSKSKVGIGKGDRELFLESTLEKKGVEALENTGDPTKILCDGSKSGVVLGDGKSEKFTFSLTG